MCQHRHPDRLRLRQQERWRPREGAGSANRRAEGADLRRGHHPQRGQALLDQGTPGPADRPFQGGQAEAARLPRTRHPVARGQRVPARHAAHQVWLHPLHRHVQRTRPDRRRLRRRGAAGREVGGRAVGGWCSEQGAQDIRRCQGVGVGSVPAVGRDAARQAAEVVPSRGAGARGCQGGQDRPGWAQRCPVHRRTQARLLHRRGRARRAEGHRRPGGRRHHQRLHRRGRGDEHRRDGT